MRLVRTGLAALAVDAATVREMDRRTIGEYGIPGAVLMENAGSAAAGIAREMAGQYGITVVFAGAGNNAGDGFVIARYLANAGVPVRIVTAVAPAAYKGDAALNFRVVQKMIIPAVTWEGTGGADLKGASLVVDALLGTGLSGSLRPPFAEMIGRLNAWGGRVLAVDIPSGIDSDSGAVLTAAVRAEKTVTFALPKKGLFVGAGAEHAGEVILADIGMPRDVYPAGKAPFTS